MSSWPQPLDPVTGPFPSARIDGAADGMGDHGPATKRLAASGQVPPDLLTGLTLFLLAHQPMRRREQRPDGGAEGGGRDEKASPIAGSVWVRERLTIHRPLERSDPFVVCGENTGRHVHKSRRYGTTTSSTVDSAGRPVATNVTTGLLAYKVAEGLADGVEGQPAEETPVPGPDHGAAAANPHVEALRAATVGTRLGGEPVVVSLAMMAARDTTSSDNPIHSDPEEARKAGLARPIAGGSHVQAFAFEPILAAFGSDVLFHGAHIDTRWKAPTEADATIVPTATVSSVTDDRVVFDLEVTLIDGADTATKHAVAMVGTVEIPLGPIAS